MHLSPPTSKELTSVLFHQYCNPTNTIGSPVGKLPGRWKVQFETDLVKHLLRLSGRLYEQRKTSLRSNKRQIQIFQRCESFASKLEEEKLTGEEEVKSA